MSKFGFEEMKSTVFAFDSSKELEQSRRSSVSTDLTEDSELSQQVRRCDIENDYEESLPNGKLSFFVTADFGEVCEEVQQMAAAMDAYARNHSRPSFIFGVGDNFYPNAPVSCKDSLFNEVWRNQFLRYPSLRVPWRMALGNHDYEPNPYVEVDYHYDQEVNSDKLWYMPDRYYRVVDEVRDDEVGKFSVDFFVMDTNGCDNKVPRHHPEVISLLHNQVRQLDNLLPASPARWKLLFGHHPMYNAGRVYSRVGLRLRDSVPYAVGDALLPGFGLESVCVRHGVDAYFAGHEHMFQAHKANGVQHFCCGASGACIRGGDGFSGGKVPDYDMNWIADTYDYGFVAVEITYHQMATRFINVYGEVLAEFIEEK